MLAVHTIGLLSVVNSIVCLGITYFRIRAQSVDLLQLVGPYKKRLYRVAGKQSLQFRSDSPTCLSWENAAQSMQVVSSGRTRCFRAVG